MINEIMKRFIYPLASILIATVAGNPCHGESCRMEVTPGSIASHAYSGELPESVTLAGIADASDIYALGEMKQLREIDMSELEIVSYMGKRLRGSYNYASSTIPRGAFAGSGIVSCRLPEGLRAIESGAFMCSSIETVTIPDNDVRIDEGAYACCGGLKSVTVMSGKVGDRAFDGCVKLTELTLGRGVSEIGQRAFSGTGVRKIDLGETSVRNIGDEAFARCGSLQEVTLGGDDINYGQGVFMGCERLKDIKACGMVDIPGMLFAGCGNVQVDDLFVKGMKTAGALAFAGNRSVSDIKLPETLERLGDYCMAGAVNLRSIDATAAESVPALGRDVWSGLELQNIRLTVRKETESEYRAAPQWRDFDISVTGETAPIGYLRPEAMTGSISGGYLTVENIPEGTKTLEIYDTSGLWSGEMRTSGESEYRATIKTRAIAGEVYIVVARDKTKRIIGNVKISGR